MSSSSTRLRPPLPVHMHLTSGLSCLRCAEPCQVPLSLLAQQAQASEGQTSELAAVKAEAAELLSRVTRLEQLVAHCWQAGSHSICEGGASVPRACM